MNNKETEKVSPVAPKTEVKIQSDIVDSDSVGIVGNEIIDSQM